MSLSIQEAIKQKIGNLERVEVDVADWDQKVTLLELSAQLLDLWESHAYEFDQARRNSDRLAKFKYSIRAVLLGMSICEADGSRPFNSKDGFIELSRLPAAVTDKLFDECQKLNRLGKYFEETVGNSEDDQSSDSSESLLEVVRSIPKP